MRAPQPTLEMTCHFQAPAVLLEDQHTSITMGISQFTRIHIGVVLMSASFWAIFHDSSPNKLHGLLGGMLKKKPLGARSLWNALSKIICGGDHEWSFLLGVPRHFG